MTRSPTHRLVHLFAASAALTLAACGGGGNDSSSPGAAPAPAPAPTVAASCASLQNGTYRLIAPAAAKPADTVTIAMDAKGVPKLTYSDGSVDSLTAGSEACTFTSAGNATSVAVSQSGLMLAAMPQTASGPRYPALLFPEQAPNVADLAATWNRIEWIRAGDGGLKQPFKLEYGTLAIAAGALTGGQDCPAASTGSCTSATLPVGGFATSASGGFAGTGELSGLRAFVFKAGNDVLLVGLDPDGSITLATRQAAQSLPAVGAVNKSWNTLADTAGALAVAGTDALPGLSNSTNTVTSVDAATGVFTRDSSNAGGAAVSQTLRNNAPLQGMRKRDGAAGVAPVVILRLTSDLAASARLDASAATTPGTGNGFFGLSLAKP